MCGSPRSLPRALSCDAGATVPGEVPGGSISRAGSSRLSPTHTPSPLPVPPPATLAFEALDVRDPEPFS